jgi:Ca2+-binding RTX toxin-like protein
MTNLIAFIFTPEDDTAYSSSGWDIAASESINTFAGNDSVNGERTVGTSASGIDVANNGSINTGEGNDSISGKGSYGITSRYSSISTGSGNDIISGSGLTVYGISLGGGTISGGVGDDTIQGSGGEDGIHTYFLGAEINGDSGEDSIFGTGARHGIYHFAGTISGGEGNDTISGVDNNDTILLSNDTFGTDSGIQNWAVIDGGLGDDLIIGKGIAVGIDNRGTILGGDGNDTINALNGGFQGYGHSDLGNGDDTVKGFGYGIFDGSTGTDSIILPIGTYTISNSSISKGSVAMNISNFEKIGGVNGIPLSLLPGTFIVDTNGIGSFQQLPVNGDSSGSSSPSTTSPVATTPPVASIPEETQPIIESSVPVAPITVIPSPTEQSPVLGIQPFETITAIQLTTSISVGSLQISKAVVGTPLHDVITGSDEGEVLAGGGGNDQLTGGGGPDAFLFETQGEFGKRNADKITDFSAEDGDILAVSQEAFSGLNRIKFTSVSGKRQAKQSGRTNKNFIYDERSGMLYYDGNGKKNGWGDGGEFVQLLGSPEIGKTDIAIV